MMSAMCITYSYRVEAELGVDIGKGGGLKINTTICFCRLNGQFVSISCLVTSIYCAKYILIMIMQKLIVLACVI